MRSAAVEGFHLAYDYRPGTAGSVVLLHGWPGDRSDWRRVVPLLPDGVGLVVPDLRGFGGSDKHRDVPDEAYGAPAQARSVVGLIVELGLGPVVLGAYDIGSRTAQTLAQQRPDLVSAMVLSPPLPGAGRRILDPDVAAELWYYGFHRSGMAAELIDGDRDRVRAYLRDRWQHWSGPDFELPSADLERLVDCYAGPGDFAASVAWYQAGAGLIGGALAERAPARADRTSTPVSVLWQEFDPTFPRRFADRLDDFFADVTLTLADGVGHFTPLEAPDAFARLLTDALRR